MSTYSCTICPRRCGADREEKMGVCGAGRLPSVAKAYLHRWEEPCISGSRGSGTVFFSGCSLKCVFCQNFIISQKLEGREISIEELAKIYLRLQEKGAHNINLVSPTHYIPQIAESLRMAKGWGMTLPVVYNSNGYESLEGLKTMEGLADVYLPDIKYFSDEAARRYSGVENYFEHASRAVLEMFRQVGQPVFDGDGIIKRGLIIRHLILPGMTRESFKILDWISANLPKSVYISLMSQYVPYYKASEYPEINRRIIRREEEKVQQHFFRLGLENGYVQERQSADEEYIPDFDMEGI